MQFLPSDQNDISFSRLFYEQFMDSLTNNLMTIIKNEGGDIFLEFFKQAIHKNCILMKPWDEHSILAKSNEESDIYHMCYCWDGNLVIEFSGNYPNR